MEASQPASAHWCHQCSAQTATERAVGGGDLVCADCGGGFIEAMESARALNHVRRAVRRHERSEHRRFRNHSAALRRLEAIISEADLSSPAFRQEVHRLVHLVDLFPLHSRSSMLHDTTSNDVTGEALDADETPSNAAHSNHVLVSSSISMNTQIIPNEVVAHGGLNPLSGMTAPGLEESELSSHVNASSTESRHANGEDECVNSVEPFNNTIQQEEFSEIAESHEDEGEEGSAQLLDNIDEDDEASDSDVDVSVLELSDWDSLDEDDEDEWEEVEENNDRIHEHDGDIPLGGNVPNARISHEILRRLHTVSRNLQNFNPEMDLEHLNFDTYIGNPGDYVGAHGFEELLQQFMDSDSTLRGPPPAAKSAIEGLPTVLVQQVDVENGSALCAICKDSIEFNEPAKQLPCLHLYHSECILPWLTVRNSCPVCRHELPTDDPDYEEQRMRENMRLMAQQQEQGNSDSSSVLHEAGRQELDREGNQDGESTDTEANVLLLERVKGEVGGDSEARDCPRGGSSGNRPSHERGSLLDVIAGPLFSVVGLVVVSCLGNLLLGSSSQRRSVNNQVSTARELRNGRSWWTNLFG